MVSCSYLPSQTDYRLPLYPTFKWVMGIWTQFLILVRQTFYSMSYPACCSKYLSFMSSLSILMHISDRNISKVALKLVSNTLDLYALYSLMFIKRMLEVGRSSFVFNNPHKVFSYVMSPNVNICISPYYWNNNYQNMKKTWITEIWSYS